MQKYNGASLQGCKRRTPLVRFTEPSLVKSSPVVCCISCKVRRWGRCGARPQAQQVVCWRSHMPCWAGKTLQTHTYMPLVCGNTSCPYWCECQDTKLLISARGSHLSRRWDGWRNDWGWQNAGGCPTAKLREKAASACRLLDSNPARKTAHVLTRALQALDDLGYLGSKNKSIAKRGYRGRDEETRSSDQKHGSVKASR